MSGKEELEKELALWQRRLQKRREQKAMFGISADPSLDIDIEDIEATIKRLHTELAKLEHRVEPLHYANVSPQPEIDQIGMKPSRKLKFEAKLP